MDARTGLPVVGMVGAGQLARMTHQAAIALGQSLRILADSADDGAALVASDVVVGDYRSLEDLRRFAAGCDVVTWDHEHVPNEHIQALAADGVKVHPGADALRFAQDKHQMRVRLGELSIPCPRWRKIDSPQDLDEFAALVGWPLVLKAATGGYDGKGVWVVGNALDAAAVLASDVPLIAEEKVPIARELAADVARSPWGQGAVWPVVETVQEDGICVEVIAPAPDLSDDRADEAQSLALRIAHELGVTGVLAVELFETTDGRLLVNELAMRPHNSAHWTIEGARTSQFEQHVRAVLDYPLGATTPTAPWTVMANLLGGPDDVTPKGIDERVHHCMATWPDVKIHLYGKGFRLGRKVGHVTALGDDLEYVRARARAAADYLSNGDATNGTHMPDALVGVIMGSDSDWPVMSDAAQALNDFDVPHEVHVVSAHRMPTEMATYAGDAAGRGLKVIIAGAGGAAHLPGMVAAMTTLPVIGVPVPLKYLDGMDSLLSIVQMPSGVPVATVGVGNSRNAGLLAVRILAAADPALATRMAEFQTSLRDLAVAKDAALQEKLTR